MTRRQLKFCEEYKKDADPRAAAHRAGYSEKTARTYSGALLRRPDVRGKLGLDSEGAAADGEEVLRLLTEIARGNALETVCGRDGESFERPPGLKERLKAIELIERRLSCRDTDGGARTVWVINDDL